MSDTWGALGNKAYDDIIAPGAKQIGRIGEDAAKTLRLLTASLQIKAAAQDRFEQTLKRISERVPDEHLISPPAEVAGAILDRMKYVSDQSELWSMFEELLTRSMDDRLNNTVHPAFAHIISQLSRDEAVIITSMARGRIFGMIDALDLIDGTFTNFRVESFDLSGSDLFLPNSILLYGEHLSGLNIITWPIGEQSPILEEGRQIGIRRHSKFVFTQFGELFAHSCIPPE